MKSIILSAILSFLAVAASAQIAPTPPYKDGASGLLANETGLSYNKQYVIDMAQYAGSRVSAQVLYTSSVFAASTFSDGSQSTGALTIVNYKSLAYTTSYFSIGGVNFYEGASGGWTAATSNAATATSDAAKRQQATSGTARGGGTAGVNQQRSTDLMAKVDNLLFGVAPEAAGALGAMGTNTLNTGEATAANLSGQAASSRQTSFAINRQTQQDVVAAIEAAMAIGA